MVAACRPWCFLGRATLWPKNHLLFYILYHIVPPPTMQSPIVRTVNCFLVSKVRKLSPTYACNTLINMFCIVFPLFGLCDANWPKKKKKIENRPSWQMIRKKCFSSVAAIYRDVISKAVPLLVAAATMTLIDAAFLLYTAFHRTRPMYPSWTQQCHP